MYLHLHQIYNVNTWPQCATCLHVILVSFGTADGEHRCHFCCGKLWLIYVTNINVKNDVYKNGYRRLSCTSKNAEIHHFVRFLMYCSITTGPVAFYWARSDDTVHKKSDKMVNFCSFTRATTSRITVFINVVFWRNLQKAHPWLISRVLSHYAC